MLSTFTMIVDVTLTQRDSVIEGTGFYDGTPPVREVVVLGFESSSGSSTPVILTFAAVNVIPAVLFGRLSANGDTLSGEFRWAFGLAPDTARFLRQ